MWSVDSVIVLVILGCLSIEDIKTRIVPYGYLIVLFLIMLCSWVWKVEDFAMYIPYMMGIGVGCLFLFVSFITGQLII